MNLKNWTIILLVTGLALSLGGLSTAADRASLTEMVRDIEIEMAAISEHAAKLDQWVEMPNLYTTSAYEYEWTGIQNRFNDVGKLVPKLNKAVEGKKEWQKEAVTELTGLIAALEKQVQAGMNHVEATQSVERIYANENYELRVRSIMHYTDHIDDVIEHIQSKTTSPTS